jgi:hypothetical protein
MAFGYLALALALALSLNAANRFVRAAGTFLAALALVMLVVSIVMANFDGTFAALPPPTSRLDPFKPLILNIQAIVASAAAAFLFWASWLQLKRRTIKPVPSLNTASTFGLISRTAHWITATLILCLVPMGLFVSVLKADSPDLPEFLAAHQSLGIAVFAVVALRLLWAALTLAQPDGAGTPPQPCGSCRPLWPDPRVPAQRLSDERTRRQSDRLFRMGAALSNRAGRAGGGDLRDRPRPRSTVALLRSHPCAYRGRPEAHLPGWPEQRCPPDADMILSAGPAGNHAMVVCLLRKKNDRMIPAMKPPTWAT